MVDRREMDIRGYKRTAYQGRCNDVAFSQQQETFNPFSHCALQHIELIRYHLGHSTN